MSTGHHDDDKTDLVHSQGLPFDVAQFLRIPQCKFVGCEQHVHFELLVRRTEFVVANNLAGGSGTNVGDDVEIGRPGLKLCLPGGNG